MRRVDRIPLDGAYGAACGPDPGKSSPPAAGKAANGNRRPAGQPHPPGSSCPPGSPPAGRTPPGRPSRSDWLETKLKCLYDEVANERLPPSLQKLIDDLDK